MNGGNEYLISPVNSRDRIISIDVLRGIAVLGILIMNIQSFSMPSAAYINPAAYGDLTGFNKLVWILSHLLASEKFMSIFSLLFGAGILLFNENAIAKGRKGGPLHYRRMMWLFIFGMVHAYLIWYGDILVAYSLCGMLAFVFRKKSPAVLIRIALAFYIVPILINMLSYFSLPYWPGEAYQGTMNGWKPDSLTLLKDIVSMRGNWLQQMDVRVKMAVFLQTNIFFTESFWRVMSMMLMGMALYKWNVLSAEKPANFYLRLVVLGLGLGYLLTGSGIYMNFRNGWGFEYSMFIGPTFNYIGSVGVALGYTAIVMLICRSAKWMKFRNLFSPVGKTAFSNYILMTILCTFIFDGHGLGLFGAVERKCQILVVFVIWLILLAISPAWTKSFRFGPLEWLWRSLIYWRWQPFRKAI